MMNFDKICNIILNEAQAKDVKFSNLVIGNDNPIFTPEDILRDPNDPSKGSKLYLAAGEEKRKGLPPGDPQSIRRQLRRLNWVSRKLIKKYRNAADGVNIDKLTAEIQRMLELYQTKVLGLDKADKANTGYETRVIGNILLPPTNRTPQGKSVFIIPGMDPNAGPEQGRIKIEPKVPKAPRVPGTPRAQSAAAKTALPAMPVSAEDVHNRFERAIQILDVLSDTDLKDIIMKHATAEGTIGDILHDPEVLGVFDPSTVRTVIRGLIKTNVLGRDDNNKLYVQPEDKRLSYTIRKSGGAKSGEDFVDPGEAPVLNPDAEVDDEEVTADTEDATEDEDNLDVTIPSKPSWELGHGDELEDDDTAAPTEGDDDEEDAEEDTEYKSADDVEPGIDDDEDNWWDTKK